LSNGWWNKLKTTNTATELKIDRFPSIYSNSETIPTKIMQKSNQLSLVSNGNYYVEKGLGDGFKMDKDEVQRVRNATLPHGNDAPDNVVKGGGDYFNPPPSAGSPPPPNLGETVAVKEPRFQDVEGVDDYYQRIRNPPFDNSTVNVLDETGRVKDALSDPALISHVDKLYEDMKTGVKITKKTGGRGAGGGRGVEMTFNGKKLDDLTPADGEALKSALTKLKRVDDEATGKVGRRIHSDYRRLDSALKGLIANASAGGFVSKGKPTLEGLVEEAKEERPTAVRSRSNSPTRVEVEPVEKTVGKLTVKTAVDLKRKAGEALDIAVDGLDDVNTLFERAIAKLKSPKQIAGEQMASILDRVKTQIDLRPEAETLVDGLIRDAIALGKKRASVELIKRSLSQLKGAVSSVKSTAVEGLSDIDSMMKGALEELKSRQLKGEVKNVLQDVVDAVVGKAEKKAKVAEIGKQVKAKVEARIKGRALQTLEGMANLKASGLDAEGNELPTFAPPIVEKKRGGISLPPEPPQDPNTVVLIYDKQPPPANTQRIIREFIATQYPNRRYVVLTKDVVVSARDRPENDITNWRAKKVNALANEFGIPLVADLTKLKKAIIASPKNKLKL
jgi:hypothetical protein